MDDPRVDLICSFTDIIKKTNELNKTLSNSNLFNRRSFEHQDKLWEIRKKCLKCIEILCGNFNFLVETDMKGELVEISTLLEKVSPFVNNPEYGMNETD